MKKRLVTYWTITYRDGTRWWGTCPVWAGQPVPADSTLARHTALVVGGRRKTCNVTGCKSGWHHDVAVPERVEDSIVDSYTWHDSALMKGIKNGTVTFDMFDELHTAAS